MVPVVSVAPEGCVTDLLGAVQSSGWRGTETQTHGFRYIRKGFRQPVPHAIVASAVRAWNAAYLPEFKFRLD